MTRKPDTPRNVQRVVRTRSHWRDRGAPVPVPLMFTLIAIASDTARRIGRMEPRARRQETIRM